MSPKPKKAASKPGKKTAANAPKPKKASTKSAVLKDQPKSSGPSEEDLLLSGADDEEIPGLEGFDEADLLDDDEAPQAPKKGGITLKTPPPPKPKKEPPVEGEFDEGRLWFVRKGNVLTLGVTAAGIEEIGAIQGAEFPAEGDDFERGEAAGLLEGGKDNLELYVPAGGFVVEINSDVIEDSDVIAEDPTDSGWLFIMEIADAYELNEIEDLVSIKASRPDRDSDPDDDGDDDDEDDIDDFDDAESEDDDSDDDGDDDEDEEDLDDYDEDSEDEESSEDSDDEH